MLHSNKKESVIVQMIVCVCILRILLFLQTVEADESGIKFVYHKNSELVTALNDLAGKHQSNAKVDTIGKSVEGSDLMFIEITKDVNSHAPLKPKIKLVGNIHGDETVSREILIYLAQYLLENFETDERIKNILETTRIFILPCLNPDGFEKSKEGTCEMTDSRYNSHRIDINSNFPDQFDTTSQKEMMREPETRAIMDWLKNNKFVMSAGLHGGSVVASYPFDSSEKRENYGVYSKAPDDEFFKLMAKTYAKNHHDMSDGSDKCGHGAFEEGITNGAYWFESPKLANGKIVGEKSTLASIKQTALDSMQDYNYIWGDCLDITVELSCCRYPAESELKNEWTKNKEALLSFIELTHRGIRGFVRDKADNKPIEGAHVLILEIGKSVTTTDKGEYWKLLAPGRYHMRVHRQGCVGILQYHPSSEIELRLEEGQLQTIGVRLVSDGTTPTTTVQPSTTEYVTPNTTIAGDSAMPVAIKIFMIVVFTFVTIAWNS